MKLVSVFSLFRPVVTLLRTRGKIIFSDRYLLYTNTTLSLTISATGDLIQQYYQVHKHGVPWDRGRTGKMAASGLVLGPFVHYWYTHLDVLCPGRGGKVLVRKLLLDQLVFSPVCIALFLLTIGVLDGQGTKALKAEFKDTGISMYLTETVVWTPAQAINFYFLPPKYRVLFDSVVSLVVETFFSYLRFDQKTQSISYEDDVDKEDLKVARDSSLTATSLDLRQKSSEVKKQVQELWELSSHPHSFNKIENSVFVSQTLSVGNCENAEASRDQLQL